MSVQAPPAAPCVDAVCGFVHRERTIGPDINGYWHSLPIRVNRVATDKLFLVNTASSTEQNPMG
jgi:hypothetical protein